MRWYDARARVALRMMAEWMRVPWAKMTIFESLLAEQAQVMRALTFPLEEGNAFNDLSPPLPPQLSLSPRIAELHCRSSLVSHNLFFHQTLLARCKISNEADLQHHGCVRCPLTPCLYACWQAHKIK